MSLAESGIVGGQVPVALVRFIGISELLGAIGLILPAATKIKPSADAARGARDC